VKAFDPAAARRDLPVLDRDFDGRKLVYLDSACTALKPAPVAAEVAAFYSECGGCGGRRSSHLLSQEVQRRADEARRAVAAFLNAESPNEIVFTSSTTDSMNLLARSFIPEPGRDEVLLADLSHNSALLPFVEAGRDRGWKIVVLQTEDGRLSAEQLDSRLTHRTALVVLTRASNVFGGAQPVSELIRLAHRRGAKVAVDAAQFVPSHDEDVRATDADFVAFSSHKLGGPFGVGVLYGKEHLLNALLPWRVGGGTVRDVAWSEAGAEPSWLDAPDRFEAGVQNVGGWIGLASAIEYRRRLGREGVRAHVSSLAGFAAEALASTPGLRVLGRPDRIAEGSLVSAAPEDPDFSLQELSLYLNHEIPGRAVAVRVGEHCAHVLHKRLGLRSTLRLSFGPHNTREEAALAVEAIRSFMKVAR
jgi:cysteine desulfurase/selenocysteine lyase